MIKKYPFEERPVLICFLQKFNVLSFSQLKKHRVVVKQSSKRLSKEEIKKQLKDSFVNYENIGKEDLKARVNNVEDYENIIKTNKSLAEYIFYFCRPFKT